MKQNADLLRFKPMFLGSEDSRSHRTTFKDLRKLLLIHLINV